VVKYHATIMMVLFALICMAVHIWFGGEAAVEEASTHGTTMTWSSYLIEWARDTVENLQSEFWQLAVQFALLAGLFEAISVHAYDKDQEDIKAQTESAQALAAGAASLIQGSLSGSGLALDHLPLRMTAFTVETPIERMLRV
jgi:hypothetical protein